MVIFLRFLFLWVASKWEKHESILWADRCRWSRRTEDTNTFEPPKAVSRWLGFYPYIFRVSLGWTDTFVSWEGLFIYSVSILGPTVPKLHLSLRKSQWTKLRKSSCKWEGKTATMSGKGNCCREAKPPLGLPSSEVLVSVRHPGEACWLTLCSRDTPLQLPVPEQIHTAQAVSEEGLLKPCLDRQGAHIGYQEGNATVNKSFSSSALPTQWWIRVYYFLVVLCSQAW